MKNLFELNRGSVAGYDHVRAGRNNQDSMSVFQNDDFTVAVVSDGCSGGKHSEFGSHFGSIYLTNIISHELSVHVRKNSPLNWESFQRGITWEMRKIALAVGASEPGGPISPAFVNDYLLFTVVCAVITPEFCEFASFGDGFLSVNGKDQRVGPFPGNEPPYLGYGLVRTGIPLDLLQFQVHESIPTSELDNFLIGTDGVCSLVDAENSSIPGKSHNVGPIGQLWKEDKFFKNSDAGRRHLVLVNGGVGSRFPGLLDDDTTFVAGRRRLDA